MRKDRAAAADAAASGDPEEDCMAAKLIAHVKGGKTRSINALLDAGASVDGCLEPDHAELDHAHPPLVSAAIDGNSNVVDLLIGRGANVNARGRLQRICSLNNQEPTLTRVEGARPLHAAVAGRNLHVVRSLLRNGADPNTPDDNGDTPLLFVAALSMATFRSAVEVARELIKSGADVGFAGKDGRSPLLVAVTQGNVQIVKELMMAGGDPCATSEDGAFALLEAARQGSTEEVRLLLPAAAATLNRVRLNTTSGRYHTALFAAACDGWDGTVEFLVEAGARQPTFSDARIASCPLDAAVNHGHVEVVRVLLRKKGLHAIGGAARILTAMETAVAYRRARTPDAGQRGSRGQGTALGAEELSLGYPHTSSGGIDGKPRHHECPARGRRGRDGSNGPSAGLFPL